jgi:hypothetical protein
MGTDNGQPIAELTALSPPSSAPLFAGKTLRPAFRKLAKRWKTPSRLGGGKDITDLISQDRD